MDTDKIAQRLADILPDNPVVPGQPNVGASQLVGREAGRIKAGQEAKELARVKLLEKNRLRSLKAKQEKRQALAKELGLDEVPDGQTERQARRIAEQQRRVEAIEAIEAQTAEPLDVAEVAKPYAPDGGKCKEMVRSALQLQGTSRPEILRLLTSLNINLSVQLTKQDTANLLACLLTCNEAQLAALYSNKRIPIVIKTVIRRLQDDAKLGNIDTVERLWDRVFGKGPMQLDLPERQQLQTGIIPNVPVSREAYIVIRDTLMK